MLLIAIASYHKWPIVFNIHSTVTCILNEDSTDRVLLSKSNSLKTFNAIIKLLNRFLGNTLLHWLPDKSIIENRPMVVKDVFLPKNTILN